MAAVHGPQAAGAVDESRWVTVKLDTTIQPDLPWRITPMERKVRVHPGETRRVDFIAENIRMEQQLYATQDAYKLVTDEGLPFREAHHVVGEVVQVCTQENTPLRQLPLEKMQSISEMFEVDVVDCLDFTSSASARRAQGGTAPEAVREQITKAKARLVVE